MSGRHKKEIGRGYGYTIPIYAKIISKNKSHTKKIKVTYNKLWHILLDRKIKKKDLEQMSGVSHYHMCKLANDMIVTVDVIGAICVALNVTSDQIMEFIPDDTNK